eukprot:superscaffoldBa00001442_g10579
MYDFECHYREERWQTARYFDFLKEFLIAAQHREDSDDCDPPPCTTPSYTVKTETSSKGTPTSKSEGLECDLLKDCKTHKPARLLPEVVERSLLSLLFIPLLALVVLLVWKAELTAFDSERLKDMLIDHLYIIQFTLMISQLCGKYKDLGNKLNVIETV